MQKKVFGIGLGRTGTKSLTSALNELGYRTLHFPLDVLNDCYQYDSLTDSPVCIYYKELDYLFPESKFILTIRDKESWLESWQRLDEFQNQRFNNNLHIYIQTIRQKLFGQVQFDPQVWSFVWDNYIQEVQKYFDQNPQKLLQLNIIDGQGYEKLCPFLGKAVLDKKFPSISKNIF